MADSTTKPAPSTSSAATPDPVKDEKSSELETTTANDGSIAINQDPTAANNPVDETKKNEPSSSLNTETPPALASTPPADSSVVVSEADVAAAQKESDPHESLSEQIEVLTGEVQALESKIEKLTNGVSDGADAPATEPAKNFKPEETFISTPVKAPEPESGIEPTKLDEPTPVAPTPPVAAAAPTPAPAPAKESTKPVNDIYTKVLTVPNGQNPSPDHKDLNDDATIEEGTSGIGTIGEVLIVFGMLALLVLIASPFLKDYLGNNWEAVKSIGWPTAAASLLLGFFLFLFNKGRAVFKIFAFLLFLVAAVMLVSIFDYTSFLGPLSTYLEPIASFYK